MAAHDYDTARQLIAQHFWLGRGTGTWYAPKHEIFDNQYLLTLVESGVFGLVTFVGIFVAGSTPRSGCASSHAVRRRAQGHDRDLALSLAASLSRHLPVLRHLRLPRLPDRVGDGVPASGSAARCCGS